MGILSILGDSIDSVTRDQYLEVFTTEPLGQDILVKRGHFKNKNGYNKGNGEVISNGSVVLIPEGCGATIIDGGSIKDSVTRAGAYKVQNSSASGLRGFASEVLERVKFAAEIPHDERVYFVNMLEIQNNTISMNNSIPFKDKDYRVVYLDAKITFSFRIVDPGTFVANVCGCVAEEYRTEELSRGMIKDEVADYVTEAVNKLSSDVSFADVQSHMSDLKEPIVEYINDIWRRKRGMELYAVTMNFMTSGTSRARAEQFDQAKIFGEDPNALASAAVLGQTQAMNTAAANSSGAVRTNVGMSAGTILNNMKKPTATFKCPYCNFVHNTGVPTNRRCEACGSFFSDSDIKKNGFK